MPSSASQSRWNDLLRVTRSWRLEWKLDQLLGRVAKEAVQFLDLERGVVFLLGPDGLAGRAAWPDATPSGSRKAISDARRVADQAIRSGRPVYAHALGEQQESEKPSDVRVVFCVPLTASRGILGALYVDSREARKTLSQQDQEFLEMVGLQAAVAIEHALLYQSAITDPLTGLFSHRHFQQEVEQAVRRAGRSEQPLSLIICDLDHFKKLNDTCGHEVGNQCLLQVSNLLREALRTSDVIARFGGDEFEILLPDTRPADALKVAEKIRTQVGRLKFPQKRRVTATMGIAAFPENAADAQTLFLKADEALYKAKESGRNRATRSSFTAKPTSAQALRGKVPMGLPGDDNGTPPPHARASKSSSALNSLAADQVDGHTLIRRLGMGSMGEVLLVKQPDLNREVALKRPLTPHLTPEQMRAFEQEAKVTASLNHPGVITVLSMGKDTDGRRYYTMKPLYGLSMAQILEGRRNNDLEIMRTYSFSRLLEILQRVAETLAYAHQRQVVHLDLTPGNIVVGEFGEVTVIDWGSGVSSLNRSRRGGRLMSPTNGSPGSELTFVTGSAGSMAPEQLPGSKEPPGPAADVHALGAVLYEVLTGQNPYRRGDTRRTLDAITHGSIQRPENVVPNAAIDPILSSLCMGALSKEAKKRPTAAEFADRLGRFVRRETDYVITDFATHKLDRNEWHIEDGDWELRGDEWVTRKGGSFTIRWKVPVPGAFHFVCEAWHEGKGELALLARQKLTGPPGSGYAFQFGAEWMTCTKLMRSTTIQGLLPEAGRRYRLELEYEDGWLRCFIDRSRIFEYRELFRHPGVHIGMYTCDPGVHFKPLEIRRQTWGLQMPLIRVGDMLFQSGQIQQALDIYKEMAERLGDRLEGLESRLKMGKCLASQGNLVEARAAFRSLRRTALDGYALAEEGALDFRNQPGDEPRRGLKIFKQLVKRHPNTDAAFKVIEASYNECRSEKTHDANLKLRIELERLGRESSGTPSMLQIRSHSILMRTLMHLGRWKDAVREMTSYQKRMLPTQNRVEGICAVNVAVALAGGRDDLLPADPFDLPRWTVDYWCNSEAPAAHIAIRRNLVRETIRALESGRHPEFPQAIHEDLTYLHLCLAARDEARAERCFKTKLMTFKNTDILHVSAIGKALIDWQRDDLFEAYLGMITRLNNGNISDEARKSIAQMRARMALEVGDAKGAARELHRIPVEESMWLRDSMPVQILLTSLGMFDAARTKHLLDSYVRYASGVPLHLCRIFLGRAKPRTTSAWPHPAWKPNWRLLLALWLEAKGRKKEARAVVLPAVDSRYGLTHTQPAIEALLRRLK